MKTTLETTGAYWRLTPGIVNWTQLNSIELNLWIEFSNLTKPNSHKKVRNQTQLNIILISELLISVELVFEVLKNNKFFWGLSYFSNNFRENKKNQN